MKKVFLGTLLLALSLYANTTLELYTNKSYLTKSFLSPQKVELKLPLHVKSEDIRYMLDEGCELRNEYVAQKVIKEIPKELQKLQEKKEDLSLQQNALLAKRNLYTTFDLQNEKDFSKIEKAASFLEQNILKIETKLSLLHKEIQEVQKEIEELERKPKIEYKLFEAHFTCKKNASVKISYPFEQISFQPYYDIFADTTKNTLNIVEKIALTQHSFEDLEDIDLHIYSKSFNQDLTPKVFYPHYLYKEQPVVYKDALMAKSASLRAAMPEAINIQREDLETLYSYTLKDITLKREKTEKITLSSEEMKINLKNFIDGYGNNKAYLQAEFTPQKNYIQREANLFLNALPLGIIRLGNLNEKVNSHLYLGENQFVYVKKELLKTKAQSSFFSGKTSNEQWKYTLTNTQNKPLHVHFVTKTPVSKDGDIEVKPIANPAFDSMSAEGKTSWEFELGAKETKEIIFGYEIKRSE
ncbi:MAG TPA: hypothetical protein CFH79_08880 [Sulfurospirillum sp. UBA11407]|nr:MAG TPA: hypothetical protein CFH79_08880 [Sulfurospirillum sp. UBA11407]